jgi:hypothetical protein
MGGHCVDDDDPDKDHPIIKSEIKRRRMKKMTTDF